jgi:hypothetical protein
LTDSSAGAAWQRASVTSTASAANATSPGFVTSSVYPSSAPAVAGPVFAMSIAGCRNSVSWRSGSSTVAPDVSVSRAVATFVTGFGSPSACVAMYEHV